MLDKQFIQDYFNADFRDIDSLLNDVLVPIFGAFNPGYDEITLSRDAKEKAAQSRIKKIKHVATLPAMGMDIKVFDVTLDSRCHIHRARKGIQMLIRQYVEKFEGAFIVFHYEDSANRSWRFSYLEKRESNVASTNAKRYTYLCGKQYPCRTLAERFEGLQKLDLTAINLEKAFSVETLSDEFFNEYRNFYQDLVNFVKYEDNLIDGFIEYAKGDKEMAEKYARDYIKKLMGRLVFIQFLQNKAWLKEDIHYTHSLFDACSEGQKDNFLDNVLEPLFFGVFNTPKDAREALFHQEHWDMTLYNEWKDFPYLNGGLFECDELDKLSLPLPSYFFSNPGKEDKVRKPNDEYYSDACGIFDFFDRYNFTIDESDPLDREIGVDPEMLGKIFENLLEDNKDKGAFYTPKEIVDYMCKEALTAYLIDEARKKSEVNKQRQENFEDAIRAFVNDPEMMVKRIQQYDDKQLIDLDESLRDVKICDPAIGSGAFPMGLLNLLMACRTAVNDALHKGEPRYLLKKEIIQNNIYGVDIEKGAIDIARLRFWLSIVVDLEEPEALPNFDYKFMQGNSLLEQFEGRDLSNMYETTVDTGKKGGKDTPLIIFDEESTQRAILSEKLSKYFASSKGIDKHQLRNDVNKAVRDLIAEKVSGNQEFISKLNAIDISANDKFFLWHTWFADVFNRPSKQGFDIVIGNPPYIRQEKLGKEYKALLTSIYPNVGNGIADIYVYFFSLGINLLREGGCLAYITLNKYLKTKYGKELRNTLASSVTVDKIVDFFELPIFNAATDAAITILRNVVSGNATKYYPVKTLDHLDLNELTKSDDYQETIKNESEWQFVDKSEISLLNKLTENTITLKDFCHDKIYSGIKTGLNKAFILKDKGTINLLRNSESAPIIRKYAVSTSIKKWGIEDDDKFFIATGYDLDIKYDYPTVYRYLSQFDDELSARGDKGITPYNLRPCAYYNEIDRPKIIYIHTAKDHQFFLDTEGHYINNSCYMIVTDSKFLWCFLNSKLFKFFKKIKFVAYGDGQEAGRCKLDYNKMVTVPIKMNVDETPFADLVSAILSKRKQNPQADTSVEENAIDKLIYQLYGLSEDEIKLVEKE